MPSDPTRSQPAAAPAPDPGSSALDDRRALLRRMLALGRALGWRALAAFFGMVVGVERIGSSLFYSEFGVSPEDAGIGYGDLIFEAAAITSLAAVIPLALYLVVMLVVLSRSAGRLRTFVARTAGRRKEAVLSLLRWGAVLAVFVAMVWLLEEDHGIRTKVLGLVVGGAVLCGLFILGEGKVNPFARRQDEPAEERPRRHPAVFAAMFAVFSVVLLIVSVGYQAWRDADRAKDGMDISGYPWVPWQARRAEVVPVSTVLTDSLGDLRARCLMYLGGANGDVLLFDVRASTVIRVPVDGVVVVVPTSPDPEGSPCR